MDLAANPRSIGTPSSTAMEVVDHTPNRARSDLRGKLYEKLLLWAWGYLAERMMPRGCLRLISGRRQFVRAESNAIVA